MVRDSRTSHGRTSSPALRRATVDSAATGPPASARPQRVIVDRLALEEAVKLSWQKRDGKGREVADQGSDTECDDGIESRFLAQPRWLAGTPEAGVMLGV